MSVNLRPLSLGEIFDRTAELYRKNFVLFAGLSAVYAGAIMILGLLHVFARSAITAAITTPASSLYLASLQLIVACVIVVLSGVTVAANNRAVAWVNLGEPATIFGAYKSVLPKAGRYIWLMIVMSFRIWVPLLFFVFIVGIAAAFIAGAARRGAGAGQAGSVILLGFIAVVGVLVSLVFAIWMALRYSLAVPACVVEDLKAGQAIKRSIELSKGARGRIFLLCLLTAVIVVTIVAATQFPFLIALFKHPRQPLPLGTQVLQQVLKFFTSTLIGPIYAIGLTLFYYDQRIRKEGFDIEWMMQAAGLTALSPGAGENSAPAAADGPETAQA